jgi:hypothetical protein
VPEDVVEQIVGEVLSGEMRLAELAARRRAPDSADVLDDVVRTL